MQVLTSEDDVDGFRWWLVQWLKAMEIVYYLAVDYPHTLHLRRIYSYNLDGWLYNFCSRASFFTSLGSRTWTSGPLQRCDG
ncbi:hypothetical protein Taro_001708 [Colocasia esculenta]|uniref:Uncharacterized protein n=1 Tax=Colocasia esculenta TaxID=4460 RepID=A0A843TGN9_COLES|nr:hypothetical protein [Colocasia esculenta]